ncbi:D-alanyl-D-alanine carboxypeptidase family protein [Sediminibacillus sp. JSM 1682029]|uniref:D-alanyl-D-alanine carboxypeptidase family protein n=2 Tax=Sediminibacillus TaxID=482460 RepID=UPI0035242DEF
MKRIGILICCVGLIMGILPERTAAAPGVSAAHAVLIEQSTGRVLFEKDAHEPQRIASITKIMTAIIAIESGELEEEATASHRAVYTEGSSIYLEEGEKMKLKDLVYGLMLRSGNDAAVAIAEKVGGSLEGFVHMMNEKAAWLGMNDTTFENPHGLDSENHRSSAYDMALLMRYAMDNDIFREITGSKSYKAETRTYAWGNKNKLLTQYYEYCTGGKTGYTKKAGRTLVSTAEKNGMSLIMVTINDPDDWRDHIRLFDWGFEKYRMTDLQDRGAEQFNVRGSNKKLSGLFPETLRYPLTAKEQQQITSSVYFLENASASSEKKQEIIGKKVFRVNGSYLTEMSILHSKQTVSQQGFLQLFRKMTGVF